MKRATYYNVRHAVTLLDDSAWLPLIKTARRNKHETEDCEAARIRFRVGLRAD